MNALRVLIASGFGALIGSLAALELLPYLGISPILWPFCAVFGGIIGYLAYDLKQVALAAQNAWQTTRRRHGGFFWKVYGICTICFGLLFAHVVAAFLLLLAVIQLLTYDIMADIVIVVSVFVVFVPYFLMVLTSPHNENDYHENDFRYLRSGLNTFLPWSEKYFLMRAIRGIPAFFMRVGAIMKYIVVFIHSDARTTCFTGGLLGTAVGVFAGSWPIGALAGAAIGLVSYELIGKRLIKTTST